VAALGAADEGASPGEGAIVSVSELSYTYPTGDTPVLRNVSFHISPGELVVVVGSSGSGMSTLALCLTGLIPHALGGSMEGRVEVDGLVTAEREVAEIGTHVGLVFQDPDSQFCGIYVEDELAFGLENLGFAPEAIRERVARTLALTNLAHLKDRLVTELSGGQKQRVAIASILTLEPRILILDTPTANLDPASAVQLFDLVTRLRAELGITVIVIENHLDDIIGQADRLIVLHDGALLAEGCPRDVIEAHGHEMLRAGIELPTLAHAGLVAREMGYLVPELPLSVDEAIEALGPLASSLRPTLQANVADSEPIIEVRELSFVYGSGVQALDSVTFDVRRGDIVGLLGANGSGKTTLAMNLVGLLKPSSGDAVVAGKSIAATDLRTLALSVGYVFQYPEHQFVAASVFDEIAFGIRVNAPNTPKSEVADRVASTIETLGLAGLEGRHPFSLSTGQKRRLSVATMLVLDPAVLILDEPTTGQDRRNIDDIATLMVDMNARGITIVVITHDMVFVEDHVRTAVVLDGGRVRWQGPPSEMFQLMGAAGPLRPPPLYGVWEHPERSTSPRSSPLTPASLKRALAQRAA
jgi:energy-coupling factor transport system ATP-binding protein